MLPKTLSNHLSYYLERSKPTSYSMKGSKAHARAGRPWRAPRSPPARAARGPWSSPASPRGARGTCTAPPAPARRKSRSRASPSPPAAPPHAFFGGVPFLLTVLGAIDTLPFRGLKRCFAQLCLRTFQRPPTRRSSRAEVAQISESIPASRACATPWLRVLHTLGKLVQNVSHAFCKKKKRFRMSDAL